jgi:hypothetical protein
MWVMLGEPAFTMAIPCWVGTGNVTDELGGNKTSPLCDVARALRDSAYIEVDSNDGENESNKKRMVLETDVLPSIWATVLPMERSNLKIVADAVQRWRTDRFNADEAMEIHRSISDNACTQLSTLSESLIAVP